MKPRTLLTSASAIVLIALGLAVTPVYATDIGVKLDQPFAIGEQTFERGEVRIASTGHSGLLALMVDDRQIAWLNRQDLGARRSGDVPTFFFRVDEDGVLHLMSAGYRTPNGEVTRWIRLSVANMAQGVADPSRIAEVAGLVLQASR